MKHLIFFIVLVSLTVLATSLVLAGDETSVKAKLPGVTQVIQRPHGVIEDTFEGRIQKMSKRVSVSTATASPKSKKLDPTVAGVTGLLTGDYHIPSAFPFDNIEHAVMTLNGLGISDNVNFILDEASYTENPITFEDFDNPDGKTVTIKPATGVAVTIHFVSTLTDGKGFSFNGAKNVTIDGEADGITLEYASVFPTDDPFGATIFITGASENLVVKNTHIKGIVNNAVWADHTDGRPAIFIWNADADPAWADGITFDGITVTGASTGLKTLCEGANFSVSNLTLKNSFFGSAYGDPLARAFIMEWAYYVTFENNVFDGIDYPLSYYDDGLYTEYDLSGFYSAYNHYWDGFYNSMLGLDGSVVKHNIFQNFQSTGAYGNGYYAMGMRVYPQNVGVGTSVTFYNNKFLGGWMDNNRVAIFYGDGNPILYHNTFRLTGTQAFSGQNRRCVYNAGISYNNVVSNETFAFSGGYSAPLHGFFPVGTIDNNAIYVPQGLPLNGLTPEGAVAAGYNTHGVFGVTNLDADLNITTGPSSAEDIGRSGLLVTEDFAGAPVDVSTEGTRDAGVYQFATGVPIGVDVFPAAFTIPPSGIPYGPPQIPTVTVKNNSASTTDSFFVTVEKTAGAGTYLETKKIALLPMESRSVAFPAWIPPSAGSYTLTATTALTGDIVPGNDIVTKTTVATNPIALTAPKIYTWDIDAENWTATTGPSATTDWKRKNNFTKLGGPKSGYSWVTECPGTGLSDQYTEGAYASSQGYAATYPGANLLTSPWLDISGLTGSTIYIALDHSIKLEPEWDRAWLRYTTDGLTWHHLGKLNDPKGVNIYNESVYEFAHSDDANGNIDEATLIQYGLIPDADALPIDTWASNGGTTATGPFGWVYAQLRINAGDYTPEIVGSSAIRFQYVAFADAATAESPGGWAVDNFQITNSAPTFTGNTITGTAYHDLNGNGQFDGSLAKGFAAEPIQANVDVYLTYFGVPLDTEKTDVNGVFTFLPPSQGGKVNLPGTYNVRFAKPGYAWTEPYGLSGIADVNCPSDGTTLTKNLGYYDGYVSGVKFSDLDDDGMDRETGEPGLGGWTIEVHKDSANGTLVGSGGTATDGTYKISLPPYYWGGTNPGNYVVKEVAQPIAARQKYPSAPGTHTITVTGNSGSPTSAVIDKNFGNFVYGVIKVEVTQDRNGNGVRELADGVPLTPGTDRVYVEVYKDQALIATDELADGVGFTLHRSLEYGTYGFKRITENPTVGWIETIHQDSFTVVINQGGMAPSVSYLYFKLVTVSGLKFDDKDGSGSLTGGDVGLDGWTININGTVYGDAFAVTHDGGNYTIEGVGPGSHIISETILNSDWVQTFPTSPSTYTFEAITASQGGNQTSKNFGNFKKFCVSGVKFRDRNCDGQRDGDEETLAGWTINLPGQTPSFIVTDSTGTFSWCNLGPGSYTLSETPQDGWMSSTPTGGTTTFNGTSGLNLVIPFGNCKETDEIKYRTFTYEQLAGCGVKEQKALKPPSVKAPASKPWYAPTMMTVVNQLIGPTAKGGYAALLRVGETGKTLPWGKVAPYLEPAKYGDVSKTLVTCKTATTHTGPSQPFNFTNKGGTMAKRYKSIPPKTQDNKLTAELLTLQVNLALSDKGFTSTGLGAVKYPGTGPWGTNATFDAIEAYANQIMTNWAPGMMSPSPSNPSDYDALYNAVRAINLAFASASIVDTTVDGGWRAPHFKYEGMKTATEAGFLAPTAAPKSRPVGTPEETPDVYALGQNYPNPFNPTTTLSFDLPSDAVVTLKIYNLLGQEVATILDREEYAYGTYEERFDASQLASGVYLYRIVSEEITDDGSTGQSFTQVKKMVLMK